MASQSPNLVKQKSLICDEIACADCEATDLSPDEIARSGGQFPDHIINAMTAHYGGQVCNTCVDDFISHRHSDLSLSMDVCRHCHGTGSVLDEVDHDTTRKAPCRDCMVYEGNPVLPDADAYLDLVDPVIATDLDRDLARFLIENPRKIAATLLYEITFHSECI